MERPIQHQDLQVFALEPVENSNGDIVEAQLEQICQETGIVPDQIVSDHGSDLKRGIEQFKESHPQLKDSYDIAHKLAALLKRYLGKDDRWAEYSKRCGQSRNQLQQTDLAFLAPTTPKKKARFMNVEPEVSWGQKHFGIHRSDGFHRTNFNIGTAIDRETAIAGKPGN